MTTNLIFYCLRSVMSLVLPVAAVSYVRTKQGGKIRNVFDGAAVYLIFYCFVYAVLSTVLGVLTGIFEGIESEITYNVINVIIESLCVALGYTVWFKAVIKKQQDNAVGLMTGVGFSSCVSVFAYAIPSVVNVVIIALFMSNPDSQIFVLFEENVYQIMQSTPLRMFFDLLEMILLFVLETSVAFTLYRVLCCENKKRWIFAAILIRILGHTVIRLESLIDRSVIVIILAVITLIAVGMGYSLMKPFTPRTEE